MDIELNDAELVHRIGSGSGREAEAELFRRMAPRIRGSLNTKQRLKG
jgi:hypothetical protein